MNARVLFLSQFLSPCVVMMVLAACAATAFGQQQGSSQLHDGGVASASLVADQSSAEKQEPKEEPNKKESPKQQPEKQPGDKQQPDDKQPTDQPKPTDDKALQEEIKRLVEQLTAERFSERQEASRRLAEIGKPAIPALTERALGDSLEGIIRSIDILRGLYLSEDEATRRAAQEALEKVAKCDNMSASRRAQDALKAGAKPLAPPKPQPKPTPQPPKQPSEVKGDAQRVQTARLALQQWAELLPRLSGADDLKGAPKESLDELRKAVEALRRELGELEKRLEAAGAPAQPEPSEKSAEKKSPPAELPVEKPQRQ